MIPRCPIVTSTISPMMAAQTPTADGHVEECELGHIPMAIPIPSGIAKSRISSTSRTIRSVLVTTPECIPDGKGWPSSGIAGAADSHDLADHLRPRGIRAHVGVCVSGRAALPGPVLVAAEPRAVGLPRDSVVAAGLRDVACDLPGIAGD